MEAAFSFKYQARFWLEVYFSSNQNGKMGHWKMNLVCQGAKLSFKDCLEKDYLIL